MKTARSIRGMSDILPEEVVCYQFLESVFRDVLHSYGYDEIRLPLVEYAELFRRSIGCETDIVEKEMYTFQDRNSPTKLVPVHSKGYIEFQKNPIDQSSNAHEFVSSNLKFLQDKLEKIRRHDVFSDTSYTYKI